MASAVSPQQTDVFRQSVFTALAYAALTGTKRLHVMAGVTVLIEPLSQHDLPDYFISDYNLAAERITAIGASSLRPQFDLYHRQMICGRIVDGLRHFLPLISHIQVADISGRNEPVGGELDFAAIFTEIDRLGHQGFIGCEFRPASWHCVRPCPDQAISGGGVPDRCITDTRWHTASA